MSLEEFFNDNSLGDSAWNEDEIDLSAITSSLSNTTSLDVLKKSTMSGRNNNNTSYHNKCSTIPRQQSPPYILKFSNLPSTFSNFEVEDLFQSKFTRFVKFRLFWELNKNPSMNTVNEFEKVFSKDSKVAFVEVYSFRDMFKILNQWTDPLLKIYKIKTTLADRDDFQNYMDKDSIVSVSDDPSKPYEVKKGSNQDRRKSNPFGAAKPVDTQTKTLEIEEKMESLHIEDTAILRRLSMGSNDDFKKFTILKRESEESGSEMNMEKSEINIQLQQPLKLSYSAVLKKSMNLPSRQISPTVSTTVFNNILANTNFHSNGKKNAVHKDSETYNSSIDVKEFLKTKENINVENKITNSQDVSFSFKEPEQSQFAQVTHDHHSSNRGSFRGNRHGISHRGNCRGLYRGESNRGNSYINPIPTLDKSHHIIKGSVNNISGSNYNGGNSNVYAFRPAAGFLRDQGRDVSKGRGRGRGRGNRGHKGNDISH